VPDVVVVVDIVVTVMFEKVNVKVKFHQPYCTSLLVVTVVVKGPVKVVCIGFSAGAIVGTRIPSAARVTQTITRALIVSCLFKSVPPLLGDFGRSGGRPASLIQVQRRSIPRENRVWAEREASVLP